MDYERPLWTNRHTCGVQSYTPVFPVPSCTLYTFLLPQLIQITAHQLVRIRCEEQAHIHSVQDMHSCIYSSHD